MWRFVSKTCEASALAKRDPCSTCLSCSILQLPSPTLLRTTSMSCAVQHFLCSNKPDFHCAQKIHGGQKQMEATKENDTEDPYPSISRIITRPFHPGLNTAGLRTGLQGSQHVFDSLLLFLHLLSQFLHPATPGGTWNESESWTHKLKDFWCFDFRSLPGSSLTLPFLVRAHAEAKAFVAFLPEALW